MAEQLNLPKQDSENFITLKDFVSWCLARWTWFAICVAVALVVAFFFIKRTEPVYTRSATLLLKETSTGNSISSGTEAFAELGLFKENTNVNNEIIALQSPALMREVVDRLNLGIDYRAEGWLYKPTLYGVQLPVEVSFIDLDETSASLRLLLLEEEGGLLMDEFKLKGEKAGTVKEVEGRIGDTVTTPVGRVVVRKTPYFDIQKTSPVYVAYSGVEAAAARYSKVLTVMLSQKESTVVDLSIKDVSPQRAEDLLNMLILIYNENWVKDKNQLTVSTSMFIDDRLAVIEQELGTVDEDISEYKSENLLPDVQASYGLYLTKASEVEDQLLALNNQLAMVRYIRSYMIDESKKTQLLPATLNAEGSEVGQQIDLYNQQLLQRNNLLASSGERNPLVQNLDRALAEMRQNIITAIDNQEESLNLQISSLKNYQAQSNIQIAASPVQAKHLLSFERQQKVKEALYLYLLQKREENELSQAFTAYNTRVITPPEGPKVPGSPNKMMILLLAVVLGVALPAVAIFLIETLNTTVRGRKDLENMDISLVGEIPLVSKKRKFLPAARRTRLAAPLVVKAKSRDVINEAFRILRTNLEFMVGKGSASEAIMVISLFPDSGKTFTTLNLGMALAIKGKKTLLIDLDLRKASLSEVSGVKYTEGVADYLNNPAMDANRIVCKMYDNLDLVPVGSLPPNPAELLAGEGLSILLDALRGHYDYVLIDCPPTGVVADASLIAQVADRTLFVVRAGLFDKSLLPEIKRIYAEQKYPKMALVLNGVVSENHRYHRYGRGYGYGYGYGYAYGKGNKDVVD